MSGYADGREAGAGTGTDLGADAETEALTETLTEAEAEAESADGESWFERAEAAVAAPGAAHGAEDSGQADESDEADETDPADEPEALDPDDDQDLVQDDLDSDPQQWISGLIADLERAEQGIGSGPRDVLMARIRLAQAYSELGDMVQAAPLAMANVAQARRLFPSSEGMLRQLREFRDAACEAAGWTAAMMREPEDEAVADEEPSELVARPGSDDEAAAEAAEAEAAEATQAAEAGEAPADDEPYEPNEPYEQNEPNEPARSWPAAAAVAEAWPAVGTADDEETLLGGVPEPVVSVESALAAELRAAALAGSTADAESESAGAVIHEFVRRTTEPDPQNPQNSQNPHNLQSPQTIVAPPPAELAIPAPPEPEYAEEVEATVPAADFAAYEEIIRLRFELREAHRTIDRLKHVNRKLREALEFEAE